MEKEKQPLEERNYALDKEVNYGLEVTTPAQMESFLKEFNLEAIEMSEYLNEVESMINKERDIFIKSEALNQDFEKRKNNLDTFTKNLDSARGDKITNIEAELDVETEKEVALKLKITEEESKINTGISEIDGFGAKLAEDSVFKSLGTSYNRMKSEFEKMDLVTKRSVKEENQKILDESKISAASKVEVVKDIDKDSGFESNPGLGLDYGSTIPDQKERITLKP